MSKKKPNRTPFYAQVLSSKVREEERLKALHDAARRVFLKEGNPPPQSKPDAA